MAVYSDCYSALSNIHDFSHLGTRVAQSLLSNSLFVNLLYSLLDLNDCLLTEWIPAECETEIVGSYSKSCLDLLLSSVIDVIET